MVAVATCCECETDIDVDEFDVERGDLLSCSECGANLVVASLAPLILDPANDMDDPAEDDDGEIDEDDWQ